MKATWRPAALVLAAALAITGCGGDEGEGDLTLVVISPHNENIKREFERAFSAYHAREFGQTVTIEWRNVGGGTNKILTHLRNVYSRTDRAGIDVFWGGGQDPFIILADEGLLEPLAVADDVKANIPPTFGGMPMIDPGGRWYGTAVSGFGFL